jgi:hypothetical protein
VIKRIRYLFEFEPNCIDTVSIAVPEGSRVVEKTADIRRTSPRGELPRKAAWFVVIEEPYESIDLRAPDGMPEGMPSLRADFRYGPSEKPDDVECVRAFREQLDAYRRWRSA